MNDMKYAPVVIPTLNRYTHFRQCLESLEACSGAEQTDVFIGLDYPPSEKYVEGWEKISDYLKDKVDHHHFKSLVVRCRDHNCGISGADGNAGLLMREVALLYDSFIFSEDDNVFSPNFLSYVNQGLERFKYDDNCLTVCGYNYYGVNAPVKENVYLSREYSAWGVGYWINKKSDISNCYNEGYLKSIMGSWSKIWKIYRNEPRLLNTVLLNLDSHKVFGDTVRVCYQYLNDKYSLFPTLSKVRNVGFDNSGTTIFKEDANYTKQEIDSSVDFSMDEIEPLVRPEVQKTVAAFFNKSSFMNIVILIRVVIYKLAKIDILYFEAKRRNKSLFRK
ncbi:MAG: glycosyltransferase family 2 protein [Paludibacteraceae bacterium]|nr:glycosyltransferase family 2 protein [Paludibacteraceae bacterium]